MKTIELLERAAEISKTANLGVSSDAAFIGAVLCLISNPEQSKKPGYKPLVDPDIVLLFIQSANGTFTCSEIFKAIYGSEPTQGESTSVGHALRELGYEPRKSNGRLIYRF